MKHNDKRVWANTSPRLNLQAWQIYVNGTPIRKTYSKTKAINIAQIRCGCLFEQRKVEVVDTITGEVVYQIN